MFKNGPEEWSIYPVRDGDSRGPVADLVVRPGFPADIAMHITKISRSHDISDYAMLGSGKYGTVIGLGNYALKIPRVHTSPGGDSYYVNTSTFGPSPFSVNSGLKYGMECIPIEDRTFSSPVVGHDIALDSVAMHALLIPRQPHEGLTSLHSLWPVWVMEKLKGDNLINRPEMMPGFQKREETIKRALSLAGIPLYIVNSDDHPGNFMYDGHSRITRIDITNSNANQLSLEGHLNSVN